ncbi:MAG: hypothetical protein E5X86_11490 [Mesorhizobium sp.]|uniref:hypothetical protein n=1 Tax=Mesorhizobium sp. TaxID=1871066 RepID=UPI0011FAFE84|nr:hypothetical protein [Mesorhizobium sp.]TIO17516.1 MAG: hypothetical protein E5X86_11490 [Mesorhizobium sp.]TIP90362.1 MAG: hypothetical protein E5X58_24295 [Mesorhizobium sp.]
MNNDSVSLFRMRAIAPSAIITLLVPGFTFAQAGNPMWQSGYDWTCEATARTICERDGTCKIGDAGGVKFEIEYENSRALFPDGTVKIKRHYRQTVNDSPLQAEVKVELADNRVLWLTAVDASRTYSQAWTGAIVEPKGGVVLSITQGIFCLPESAGMPKG